MKVFFLKIMALLIGLTLQARAQVRETPVPLGSAPLVDRHYDFSHIIDDSSILVRAYHRQGAPATFEPNKGIYIIDMRFKLPITASESWQVKGRVGTGPSATDDTTLLAEPVKPYFKTTFNMRELYVEARPKNNLTFQAGALELLQPGVNRSALSDSAIGWVDGVRADMNFSNAIENADVTVGHLGANTQTSAIARFENENIRPNFMQVKLKVSVAASSKLTLEQTQLSSEALTRIMMEQAVAKGLRFIDQIVLEEMLGSGDETQKGIAVGLKKKIGATELYPTYVFKSKSLNPEGSQKNLPLDSNYYPGNQFLLVANHYVNEHQRLQMRYYKFTEPFTVNQPNHGWLADISYKYTFWRK